MAKCCLCGKGIKPWFDVCYGCHVKTKNTDSGGSGVIPEPIIAGNFMREMGIDSWR